MRILHSRKLILISKPRSGSTSVRRVFDKYLEEGDIKCDVPFDVWHPHHTATRLNKIFIEKGWDFSEYSIICTSRNPYDLLVSYYFYFQPDIFGRYNFQNSHINQLMTFSEWIMTGKTWDHTKLEQGKDLSTIGVENYCYDENGNKIVDYILDINDMDNLRYELKQLFDEEDLFIPYVNQSKRGSKSYQEFYDDQTQSKVKKMFFKEFELFDYSF